MKKPVIMNLGVAVVIAALAGGCQIGGPSDQELIGTTMADWKTALIAQDLDKLMPVYSENYVSTRGGGKDSVREFMMNVFNAGYLDNAKVNLEGAKTTIEEDKAEFGPVEVITDTGTYILEYTLQKEDGTWLIVGSEMHEQ